MTRTFPALIALLLMTLPLAACGGEEADPAGETRTAANGEKFNDADVTFASDMVQHHAQAMAMVDMTLDRTLDPRVQQLAADIRAAQGPEIETMTDWLTEWDQPIPETSRDHAHAHGGDEAEVDEGMPGMMSSDEMDALMKAPDRDFQTMWLEMMVEHHEGAVEMARTEQEAGANPDAIALAERIEASQQKEIEQMQAMLDK